MQFKLSSKEKEELRNQLYERDGTKCHYCGIEEKDFPKIWGRTFRKGRRGRTLEVDHKDSREGYKTNDPENCVLACYACNNAKSDVFTYEEFKKVGNVIREIWQRKSGVAK